MAKDDREHDDEREDREDREDRREKPFRFEDWIERDLTAAARDGEISPAFQVEDPLEQVEDILRSPQRFPIIVGPPGVGKSTIVHEIVRRAAMGRGPERLRGLRVVQLSLRGIAGRFTNKEEAAAAAQKVFGHILDKAHDVVPFIRDIHTAYSLDWEPILYRFVSQLKRPLFGESPQVEFDSLVDYWPDLNEFLVPVVLDEPTPDVVREIVRHWSAWRAEQGKLGFTQDAQRTAIELTARFMGNKRFPRKAFSLLNQTADVCTSTVEQRDVVERFSQLTRVPAGLVDPKVQLDLVELQRFLSDRLLGQHEAVEAMVRMIALIKAGMADLRRPFGVFLFVGPTGVGKTHTAQLLAEYLFNDRQKLIRVNMADYAGEHDSLTLFGNPHANRISDQRGILAQRLAGHPFGVLLLDEFEKAHAKVHDAFLQLVDEGRFITGRSEVISATSLIIIATSNEGANVYRETGIGFSHRPNIADLDAELDKRLYQRFRFEFLNRFDRIVHFHPLDRTHIRAISRRELGELLKREGIEGRGLSVDVDLEVLDWLVANGYHPHYGARFLRREMERHVTGALAEFIVKHQPPPGTRLHVGVKRERIEVRFAETQAEIPAATTEADGDRQRLKQEPAELFTEARAWLDRWQALETEWEQRKREVMALQDRSQQPGFWDDEDAAQTALRRYKSLDARLQADRRLLAPVHQLKEQLEKTGESSPPRRVAELVEQASRNYRRWLELGGDAGPGGAWLVLGPADPLNHPSGWLATMVRMYRGWFRHQGFQANLVAEQVLEGQLQRVVFEVEGAGALQVLEMEQGQHGRRGPDGEVERVLVDVLHRHEESAPLPRGISVQSIPPRQGLLIDRVEAHLRIAVPGRGLTLDFDGPDAGTLQLLGRDLGAYLAAPPPEITVARTYGQADNSVYDPRTAVKYANLPAVLRGRLDPFLTAWEAR